MDMMIYSGEQRNDRRIDDFDDKPLVSQDQNRTDVSHLETPP